VTIAPPAKGKAPDITSKPGKFRGRFSGTITTGSGDKTAQLKNYSGGIEEGVGMGTVDRNFLVPARHCPATDLATNGFSRADPFFSLFLFNGPAELAVVLSVIGPKTLTGAIYHLHGNIPQ
jgi:hypothetical protein